MRNNHKEEKDGEQRTKKDSDDSRVHHISVCYTCLLRNIIDTELFVGRMVNYVLHNCLGPVSSVAQQPEVTERLLRATRLALFLAQFI